MIINSLLNFLNFVHMQPILLGRNKVKIINMCDIFEYVRVCRWILDFFNQHKQMQRVVYFTHPYTRDHSVLMKHIVIVAKTIQVRRFIM